MMKRLPTKLENDEDGCAWMTGTVLVELKPGPRPIIPKALWAEIEEWILAWKHSDALREADLPMPGALLLHGPTGSGKTSLAAAVLNCMEERSGAILEAHNAIGKHLGECEKNLADGFRAARRAGALVVIEEVDALGIARTSCNGSGADNARRNITIALMRLLEGSGVPVIATTNCLNDLDPAIVRRFELLIEVPLLDEMGRKLVLRKILEREPEPELIALPLNVSIRMAHRERRRAFIADKEAQA